MNVNEFKPKRYYSSSASAAKPSGLVLGAMVGLAGLGYLYTRQTNSGAQKTDPIKNPMVEEKVRAGQSKSDKEKALEKKAEEGTRDTSGLVGKDTDKVKEVWSGQENRVVSSVHEKEDEPVWRRMNPMVAEKQAAGQTKTEAELRMEASASQEVHDTTGLVKKDTEKVAPMWKGSSSVRPSSVQEKGDVPFLKRDSTGNPMVDEKLSSARTKTDSELALEAHAEHHVHDTSGLVEKDTKKVEPVWHKNQSAAGEGSSFWQGLWGVKSGINSVQNELEWAEHKVKAGLDSAKNTLTHHHTYRLPAKFIVEHARVNPLTCLRESRPMAGKFIKLVVIPVATVGFVSALVRQPKPAEAHTDYMKPDAKTREGWKEANDGLSVQDVGRSGGGV